MNEKDMKNEDAFSENAQNNEKQGIFSGNNFAKNFKNNPRKNHLIMTFLLSLLAAVIMWLFAVDYEVEDYEKTFTNIGIQITGKTELLGATGMQVELEGDVKLSVTVSGKRSVLSSLNASSFTAYADVSGITKEGKSDPLKVKLEPVNGVTVVSQSITHITVVAEKRVTDTFEIVPILGTAQLENGVSYSLLCEIPTVTVTGSESIVKGIKRAVVYVNPEPKNVTSSFKSHCEIVFESDVGIDTSSLVVSPHYCGVDVILTKEKSVPLKIKLEGGADVDYDASFHLAVSSVLITGEPRLVDGVERLNLTIPHEKIKNQLGSGKESFAVKGFVEYPDGISGGYGITEVEVMVDVSERVETVYGENVVINNCPSGYIATASDVEINLKGIYEEMEKINGSDITVTVDLSEIAPSEREQKVKALVNIENSYGTVYEKQCLVTVVFKKA